MKTNDVLSAAWRGFVLAALLGCSGDGPAAPAPASPAPRATSDVRSVAAPSSAAAAAPAPGAEAEADEEDDDTGDELRAGVAPLPEGREIPPQLAGRWELKEVRYKSGRKAFVPKRYGNYTLFARGGIRWTDGCNGLSTSIRIEGNKLSLGPEMISSALGCDYTPEDIHYEQATHYRLERRALHIHTPSQIYVLERFPYSKLSEHGWSLHSIKDRQSGVVFKVDRFRTEARHLRLAIEKDSTFHFTDLDHEEFTGSLQIEGEVVRAMAYDEASKERLRNKPEQWGHLQDSTRGYRETKKKYRTTYAHRIDWEAVTSFKVYEGMVRMGSEEYETEILELHSDKEIYRFVPR